ncbi:Cysteine and histidine-rich domain-containing protein RAR1 [Dichanthelium oligosanthes]|uniref:Cysteine and histidine-rich domain-containing protein RAR1 n=1 Tax=Dichanthelium oligosanthes TaxID=888268 RepID=A0A1E5UIW1_9POAL|nr:Cysteine and histidine-rich domain-containing protein RAR1 [Dichanthelium oligosanthes]
MSSTMEAAAKSAAPARCQRMGCDAMFTDDNNPEGCCQYHPSEVTCRLFLRALAICYSSMGDGLCDNERKRICTTGKHTSEKPVTKSVCANPPKAAPIQASKQGVGADACARCRQGFFCSDHGSQPKAQKPAATNDKNKEPVEKSSVPPPKKKVDINEPRICKNKGCGKSYKEKDNHDSACEYHPGPAVFHDRMRGWKCCDIHVKEFDEFMEIPPCTKGWHNADAV